MADEVVVVIGAGGMGQAIARRQGSGRKLVLADFDQAGLDRTVEALRGEGHQVDGHVVDVSSATSVTDLADAAAAAGGVVQVIHTAGLSPTQATVDRILHVDLLGVAHVLDAFGAVVAPGGAGVVIASMAGSLTSGRLPAELEGALALTPTDQLLDLPFWTDQAFASPGAAYGLAKRANQLRVQAASRAWGARRARINSVSPGVISTPMGQEELDSGSGAQMRAMVEASGTKRLGTPGDIADAVAFLLGPESSFVTGTDLLVDGGVVAAVRSGALANG
ncbi:NAD(P)-dependent dehydrogenase, short-chain alcohol dehydrogenase family [Promicromonospora umidemergens]|uniref:SDR family oxidoreductase n=1 Tax=Promicromonospora umidemergens TaxID=629679 RepID=A0ABP8Y7C4_9MICO|nr:SDR family oxidoreductase [Promicromonospora umidemergens]MCP2282433.1 NAD(P)-dependent dehydrogenase, short-chain alcohol dehydrogenase family [Promicromonospora umidemergens]